MGDHFNDFGIVNPCCPGRFDLLAAQVPAAVGDLPGEGSVSVQFTLPGTENVWRGQPGLAGKQRVGRQAIVATVDLGRGEENRFFIAGAQGGLAQGDRLLQIRSKHSGRVSQCLEDVGQEADFLLHAFQQWTSVGGGLFETQGVDAIHGGARKSSIASPDTSAGRRAKSLSSSILDRSSVSHPSQRAQRT